MCTPVQMWLWVRSFRKLEQCVLQTWFQVLIHMSVDLSMDNSYTGHISLWCFHCSRLSCVDLQPDDPYAGHLRGLLRLEELWILPPGRTDTTWGETGENKQYYIPPKYNSIGPEKQQFIKATIQFITWFNFFPWKSIIANSEEFFKRYPTHTCRLILLRS